MIKDNYNSCAGAGSPGDGEKPRGCRTAGRQRVKSNQLEKFEGKPPEKDLFFKPEVKRGSRKLLPCDFPTPQKTLFWLLII